MISEELNTIHHRINVLLGEDPELVLAHPNERLMAYWKRWDGFGDVTLEPTKITKYTTIDRAFRDIIPDEFKNRKREEDYREHYGKK